MAILFSSDQDLLSAVQTLFHRPICHVEVAALSRATRIRVDDTQLPWCHFLSDQTFGQVRDWFHYSGE